MRRHLAILLWVVTAILLNSQAVRAECITRPASAVLADSRAELIFSGTVTTVTRTAELGYRVTFAVDRVWKGTVPNVFDVYVWEMTPETEQFRERMQAVVVARRMVDPRVRSGVGLKSDSEVAFMLSPCNAGLFLTAETIGSLGLPRVPDVVTPLEKHDDWVVCCEADEGDSAGDDPRRSPQGLRRTARRPSPCGTSQRDISQPRLRILPGGGPVFPGSDGIGSRRHRHDLTAVRG